MRFLIYGVALGLAAFGVDFGSQSQTQGKLQGKLSGKGAVVEGTVIMKGKPLPGVVILLRASDDGPPHTPSLKAKSDQEGKYRITDVPSGTYYIAPATPIFVVGNAKDLRGHSVVVVGGETVEGIDFELIRGGIITGRVVDVEGRPIIEQRVFLMDADQVRSQRRSVYANEFFTDDRGIYRIFGIAAGRYKIATGRGRGFSMSRPGSNSLTQTFYPDVSDESKAMIVDITEGSEVSNINITVGRVAQTFSVSGQVTDGENGQPIASARFGLQQFSNETRHGSVFGNLTTSNSKGEFKLDGLLPGKYGIFLARQSKNDLRSSVVPFEIIDQDVTGVIIKTSTGGASLTGVVVLENSEDKAVLSRLIQLDLYGHIQNSASGPGFGISSSIGPDGSFSFDNLEPGSFHISLGGPDRFSMKGFNVWRIERNGIVESNGIELKNGDRITDVRFVVSYGTAAVHGVVKLEKGPLPVGAHISVRLTKEGMNTHLEPDHVDGRGHFIIEGIPAGLYTLETNIYQPGTVATPKPPVKQQLNIAEGVVSELTITLQNPNPGSSSP